MATNSIRTENDSEALTKLLACALFATAIAVGVFAYLGVRDYQAALDWPERGTRGDFWGGHIAAAGSVISVILLILTVFMQRFELHYQREELRATRREMEQAREVHDQQRAIMAKQAQLAEASHKRERIYRLIELRESIIRQCELEVAANHGKDWSMSGAGRTARLGLVNSRTTILDHQIGQMLHYSGIPEPEKGQLATAAGVTVLRSPDHNAHEGPP